MTIKLTDPIFSDETKAREHLESLLWPQGAFCPRCGEAEDVHKLNGKTQRPGLYQCNPCHRSFSVTVNTVMERSHIPLTSWAAAFQIYCASKKGFSAHQLHRMLGITYKSAWFLAHRVREAMGDSNPAPLGGKDKIVEADETYIGRKPGMKKGFGRGNNKMAVMSLVERGGPVRSFPIENVKGTELGRVLLKNVSSRSHLRTDEWSTYYGLGMNFASHETVKHGAKEYVRGDVHTNTIEGFFSIFKRGMKGVYQHCSEQHLHRYLKEFDFRYSNRMAVGVDDLMRTMRAIKGAQGKRLTYRQAGRKAA
jgi:transposase-like protein